MSNNEALYSQNDMDNVLAAIAKFKKEADQSHQLLWAVIHEAGGEIVLPHLLWMTEQDTTKEIIIWDDPVGLQMHLKVQLNV